MCHAQERENFFTRIGVETIDDVAAHQTLVGVFDDGLRAHVGFHHAVVATIDHHHSFAGGVEQNAVARFDVAQTQIIALHRLLGFDQTTLQNRNGLEVAAQREEGAVMSQGQHSVLQREDHALRREVVDVAPADVFARVFGREHFLNFGATFQAGGLRPGAPQPRRTAQRCEFGIAHGDILNDALVIHDERNVGSNPDQFDQGVRFKIFNFHESRRSLLSLGHMGSFTCDQF